MTHLKVGDNAPPFAGKNQHGNWVKLEDYKKRKLILFFYPKDHTPTCTAEVCNLRDHFATLQKSGFELVGVSPDSIQKHQNFVSKHRLLYPLLADTEHQISEQYGVWGEKKMMGRTYNGVRRTTFVINEQGIIAAVFEKVVSKDHAAQILTTLS